jgi:ribosomal protein S18 acetylase RimI-like enzyme
MIRKGNENDAKVISEIRINGWKNAYRGIVEDDFLDNMDYDKYEKKMYDRLLHNDENYYANIIVYEDDKTNEVLGFSTFGEVDSLEDKSKYDCELYALYVKPENKGQGIGKQLLDYVRNYFKNNNKKNMILFCLKDNLPSRKFYVKNGGIETEEIDKQIGSKKLKEIGYRFNL